MAAAASRRTRSRSCAISSAAGRATGIDARQDEDRPRRRETIAERVRGRARGDRGRGGAVRGRQRRVHAASRRSAQAEPFAELGVTWFEEPVSSDDLEGLRADARSRARRHGDRRRRVRLRRCVLSPHAARRGAVDVLQADATRCGGITGFLQAAALCRGADTAALGAYRARRCTSTSAAPSPHVRHIEYFHDHARIEQMLFDGAVAPRRRACCARIRRRPGSGSSSSAPTQNAYRVQMITRSSASRHSAHIDRARHGTRDTLRSTRGSAGDARSKRRGALRRGRARAVRDRRLELPPGADRRRHSADDRRRRSRPSRICREHGAPILARGGGTASPASAATSRSSSTSRST